MKPSERFLSKCKYLVPSLRVKPQRRSNWALHGLILFCDHVIRSAALKIASLGGVHAAISGECMYAYCEKMAPLM